MPVMATSRKATTVTILVRIEYFASMAEVSLGFERAGTTPDGDRAADVENHASDALQASNPSTP